jgi:hypothetical protein
VVSIAQVPQESNAVFFTVYAPAGLAFAFLATLLAPVVTAIATALAVVALRLQLVAVLPAGTARSRSTYDLGEFHIGRRALFLAAEAWLPPYVTFFTVAAAHGLASAFGSKPAVLDAVTAALVGSQALAVGVADVTGISWVFKPSTPRDHSRLMISARLT